MPLVKSSLLLCVHNGTKYSVPIVCGGLVDSCSPHRVHIVLWARAAMDTCVPIVGLAQSA